MASNIFNDIFGGSTSTSTSTPTNMNPLTSTLSGPLASTLTNTLQQGAPQYTGPLTASMTPAQQTTLNQLPGQVSPTNNVNSYINNVLNGSYMPGGANGNPFLSSTIAAANLPIQEQLQTAVSQSNPSLFASRGQSVGSNGSSAFDNANAIAYQSAANAMAGNASTIANNAYNTGVSQMTAAAQLQPQEVQSAINVLQAQLLPTLLQAQGITNGLTAFQDNVTALTTFLSTITQAEQPIVANQTTSQGTSETGILPDVTNLFAASNKKSS